MARGYNEKHGNEMVHNYSQKMEEYKRLYEELLYAVESKWEGETRHETALRYIRNCEMTRTNIFDGTKEGEQYDT